MKNLFVGNLPFTATEDALRVLFAQFGEVQRVKVMTDRDTGKPRGFAFVEMTQDDDAAKAIAALNGKDFGGRALTVNEARPKPERGGGGGFRPGGGGGKSRRGQDDYRDSARQPREPRW
jgi:cold-inducible RNA-binding protein